MSVVVSDTSPLNCLFLIGQIDSLRSLYGRVLIPDIVLMELRAAGSPSPVAVWASALPDWVGVVLTEAEETNFHLDAGELAALALAGSFAGEVFLIVDDAAGRAEATRRGLRITGTLGKIVEAPNFPSWQNRHSYA